MNTNTWSWTRSFGFLPTLSRWALLVGAPVEEQMNRCWFDGSYDWSIHLALLKIQELDHMIDPYGSGADDIDDGLMQIE